jgi:hypothetical protein
VRDSSRAKTLPFLREHCKNAVEAMPRALSGGVGIGWPSKRNPTQLSGPCGREGRSGRGEGRSDGEAEGRRGEEQGSERAAAPSSSESTRRHERVLVQRPVKDSAGRTRHRLKGARSNGQPSSLRPRRKRRPPYLVTMRRLPAGRRPAGRTRRGGALCTLAVDVRTPAADGDTPLTSLRKGPRGASEAAIEVALG